MTPKHIDDNFDILEGKWVSKSLDGVEKRFSSNDITGRDAWATSHAKPVQSPRENKKKEEIDLDMVWRKVEEVVANIFPDGDPIDWLIPWFQKQGITDFRIGDTLDKAAKKNGYEDIYDYYDTMKREYNTNEGLNIDTIRAMNNARGPELVVGDTVRTKSNEGVVEKVKDGMVFFRLADGRLMKTAIRNATVIQKLADEELNEISNEVLSKYKDAAGKDASSADASGDYSRGNKRFSGIVKATKKQFANDAKKTKSQNVPETLKFSPGSFPDVDHMPGAVYKYGNAPSLSRKQSFNDLASWEAETNRLNGVTYDDMSDIVSNNSGSEYRTPSGKVWARWDKAKNIGFIDTTPMSENGMTGINRAAPAQDVSYEKVLDDEPINELSVDTLRSYAQKTATPKSTDRLGKILKHARGHEKAIQKVATKTGDRTPGQAASRTYEERLSEFVNMDEDKKEYFARQFADILGKQDAEQQAAQKGKISSIPYHGWEIRYREAVKPGDKINWKIFDKTGNEKHAGVSMTSKDAVRDAEEWINSGGGTDQKASSKVTIDFNVDFARQFFPDGDTFYVMFDNNGSSPMMYLSTEPQSGFKKSAIRTQRDKTTGSTTLLPSASLSPNESNSVGLKPNGRYILGDKDQIDSNTVAFPLIYQSTSQSKTDAVRLGKPGLTVATSRNVDEEYRGPWQGDSERNAKAPKTTMQGSGDVRFSDMVKDTIDTHGLKYAFDYYVKKNGLPPRQFQIFAGLTANKPKVALQPAPVEQPKAPEKQSWWKKLRGKLPFEE